MTAEILIVDDEKDIREQLKGLLEDEGYKTRLADKSSDALFQIASSRPSLVLLDIWLQGSDLDGMEVLEEIVQQHSGLPVVMISGHGNIETAVQAIRKGAADFIEKPIKIDHLLFTIEQTLEKARLKRENDDLKKTLHPSPHFIGESKLAKKLNQIIQKVGATESRVFITGPVGAGKETVARMIHQISSRAKETFVALNCATMNPENVEIELFGEELKNPESVVKTDSKKPRKVGILEKAHGGTLFLDEVSDMPLQTQNKIVRVLQEQTFERVGGKIPVEVDIRIIASSSKDVEKVVQEGHFRKDLFYRLNVFPLHIPLLSERREDIVPLANYFLEHFQNMIGHKQLYLTDETIIILQSYDWPGNVRQLKNAMEWIVIMAQDLPTNKITPSILPPEISGQSNDSIRPMQTEYFLSMELKQARENFEKRYLEAQVKRFNGNISKTAHWIGMERSALHRKLKTLGIQTIISEKQER